MRLAKIFYIERAEEEIANEVSVNYSDDAIEDIEVESETPLTSTESDELSKLIRGYDWGHDACRKLKEEKEYAASVYADRGRAGIMGK